MLRSTLSLPVRALRSRQGTSSTFATTPPQIRAHRHRPMRVRTAASSASTTSSASASTRQAALHSSSRACYAKKNNVKSVVVSRTSGRGVPTEAEPQGLSARFKKLSREYGWAAMGVYLGLSVLDFPFCFLLVRWVGADKIGEIEHFLVSKIKNAIPNTVKERWHEYRTALKTAEKEQLGDDDISQHVEMAAGWGVVEAEAQNEAGASLGTQLALAYAIHKTFIFVRVPLTAAITPKIVRVLRSWGWHLGKRSKKGKRP